MLGEFFGLLKYYGPGMAPWALIFFLLVYVTGKGGRAAMSNVTTLMAEGEALRGRMKDALHDCNEQIREKDRIIKELNQDMETARITMKRLRADLGNLDDQVTDMKRQLRKHESRGEPE